MVSETGVTDDEGVNQERSHQLSPDIPLVPFDALPAAALTLVAGNPNQARPAAPDRIQVSGTVMSMAKRADAYEAAPQVQDSGDEIMTVE